VGNAAESAEGARRPVIPTGRGSVSGRRVQPVLHGGDGGQRLEEATPLGHRPPAVGGVDRRPSGPGQPRRRAHLGAEAPVRGPSRCARGLPSLRGADAAEGLDRVGVINCLALFSALDGLRSHSSSERRLLGVRPRSAPLEGPASRLRGRRKRGCRCSKERVPAWSPLDPHWARREDFGQTAARGGQPITLVPHR
jgi:hypothetical protein